MFSWENPDHFPPKVMSHKTIGKTYEAIANYIDDLIERGILQEQGYKLNYVITIGPE